MPKSKIPNAKNAHQEAKEYYQYDPDKMLTIFNWIDYVDREGDFGKSMFGYLEATEHLIKELEGRVAVAKDFASLKKEMLEFITERKVFFKFADVHLP